VAINNAAIFSSLKMKPFEQIPLQEWEQVLRVNITGCFLLARAVLPAMRRAGWGRIINITSAAVPTGVKNYLRLLAAQCIPREGAPMDLVGLVLFLSSEASGFITGQTIACDGGLTHW